MSDGGLREGFFSPPSFRQIERYEMAKRDNNRSSRRHPTWANSLLIGGGLGRAERWCQERQVRCVAYEDEKVCIYIYVAR